MVQTTSAAQDETSDALLKTATIITAALSVMPPPVGPIAGILSGFLVLWPQPDVWDQVSTRVDALMTQRLTAEKQSLIKNLLTGQESIYSNYVDDRMEAPWIYPSTYTSRVTEFSGRLAGIYDSLIGISDLMFNPSPRVDASLPHFIRYASMVTTVTLEMMRYENTYDEKEQLGAFLGKAQDYLRRAIRARLQEQRDSYTSTVQYGGDMNVIPGVYHGRRNDVAFIERVMDPSLPTTPADNQVRAILCRTSLRALRQERLLEVYNKLVEVWGAINKDPSLNGTYQVNWQEFDNDALVTCLPSSDGFTSEPRVVRDGDSSSVRIDYRLTESPDYQWYALYEMDDMPSYDDAGEYKEWHNFSDTHAGSLTGTISMGVGSTVGTRVVALYLYDWALADFYVVDISKGLEAPPNIAAPRKKLPKPDYTNRKWEKMGRVTTSNPAVVSWGQERLDLFAVGQDNQLWQRSFHNKWDAWRLALAGTLRSGPGAASSGPGCIDVFALSAGGDKGAGGTGNGLVRCSYKNGAWSAWAAVPAAVSGGPEGILGVPAVVSHGNGLLDVFMRGSKDALWQLSWRKNAWKPWTSLGGTIASPPAATSWGPGRLDVFAQGKDSTLMHRFSDDGSVTWSTWKSHQGSVSGPPAAVSRRDKLLDVFVRSAGGALCHRTFDEAWTEWVTLESSVALGGGLAAATGRSPGYIDVVSTDASKTVILY